MDDRVDESEGSTTPPERELLGERLFADYAKARNSAALVDRLAVIGIDEERVAELAGLVRRAGSLIYQRPDIAGQASRDAFLDHLRTSVAGIAPAIPAGPLERAISTIRIAERGYHIILDTLERTDIAKQPPAMRAAAAIARVEANLAVLREQLNEAMRKDGVRIPGGAMIEDEHGRPLSADVVLTAHTESLGGTIMMESYAHGWFGQDGRVELPSLPSAGDSEISMAGSSEYLAMSWRRWERFHKIARCLGEDITELDSESWPEDLPAQVTTVYARRGRVNLPDWIANERALDREGIGTAGLMVMTNAAARSSGIGSPVLLAPGGWVSTSEISNCLSLSEAVGYEIVRDSELHGGLSLVQWVRGYSALSAWAAERLADGNVGILRTTRDELVSLLTMLSLTETQAMVFLDAVSFGRKSRDLFDAPLVRTSGEWLLIGPATTSPRLARIIPSLLASKGIQLKRKGHAFEARVLAFLKKQNLDARHIHVSREGAEYEFDVVALWDRKLFLFECKNHGLSGNDPVEAHHFMQEIVSNARQVQRLVKAVARWPEIISDAFGANAEYDEVVPCILENETYSLPVQVDGVYVYDWSALSRFFEKGSFGVSRDHRLPGNHIARNRVQIKRIWSGDAPVAGDLIAEMRSPYQFAVLARHVNMVTFDFSLSHDTIAIDVSCSRLPFTEESMATAAGASPEAVRARLDEVDAQIRRVKAEFESQDSEEASED